MRKRKWNYRVFLGNLAFLALVIAFNGVIFWMLCEWVMQ